MRESASVPPSREREWRVTPARTRSSKQLAVAALVLVALATVACGNQDLPQNALDPQGPDARTLDKLWDLTFPFAVGVFFLVQGLVVFIIWRFRARSDDDAPVQVHGNAKAELGWTIAPALLLAVIGVFTVVTVFDINRRAEGSEVLQVKVSGHMWWWEFEYENFDIITANELHIPADQPVQLEVTSVDVIHSFWPPKLAGKVDAVPGRTNYMKLQADRPGVYAGQCAEFCGLSHANMRLTVVAHAPEDFRTWIRDQQREAAPAAQGSEAAAGAELFVMKGCTGCHTISGVEGANGRIGPDLTHLYSRSKFAGAVFELTDKNLRKWLRDPPAMKPMVPDNGQGMPNLGLTEEEITSLIAYMETLK